MIWNNERIHVTVKGISAKKSSQTKYLKTDNELALALNVTRSYSRKLCQQIFNLYSLKNCYERSLALGRLQVYQVSRIDCGECNSPYMSYFYVII